LSFTGEYRAKLNAKNQVVLPSSLRESIFALENPNPLILFCPRDKGFLELYPAKEWEVVQAKVDAKAQREKKPFLNRMLNAKASSLVLEPEGNGRILIPQTKVEYFRPDGEVVFIGNTKKIELWSREEYQGFVDTHHSDFESELGELFEF
jgi:MraZ protein